MNALAGTASGRGRSNGAYSGDIEATSPITTSPVSAKASVVGRKNKKRTQENAGLDSSPGSGDGDGDATDDRRRQPSVKRACNECRQQKVGSVA